MDNRDGTFQKAQRNSWIVTILTIGLTWTSAAIGVADQPNIVIILADDLGYGDPGCYNDESKIPTPHIDKLATQGMRFTDAHTPTSVCTPTRYGILTGRYCWRTKLKRSVLWPWDPPLIKPTRLTLPKMLGERGYHSACIGKWHLGWDWPLKNGQFISDEFTGLTIPLKNREATGRRVDFTRATRGGPLDRGFNYYFGDDVPNFPPYCFIENHKTIVVPTVEKPKEMFGHAGPAQAAWDLSMVMPTITQKAVKFIEDQTATPERPFFLFMTLTAPHTPIAPSPHFTGKSEAGRYGDFVTEVDWSVGQITAALERTGLANDTLLIFTSDNGSPQRDGTTNMSGPIGSVKATGHDPSRPWRGMKSDAWEAGHRVPFIARWPGKIASATTSDEPIILTDFMRTISKLVDYQLPDDAGEDSFDFLHVLLGKKSNKPVHDFLIHNAGNGLFAIRKGDWKLIAGKGSGGFTRYQPPPDAPAGQLYNLAEDPTEKQNLYESHPQIVEQLSNILKQAKTQGRTFTGGNLP